MLRTNGFHKDHIKTFFAGSGRLPGEVEGVYPALEKASLRAHLSQVCRKQHCADSLVLLLNSPTRPDGAMLLWDANRNGVADLRERYSVPELLADLAGCRATRVLLFVDQSHSAVLSKRLRGSQKHPNVVLVLVPGPRRDPQGPQREDIWARIGPASCLLDHLWKAPGAPPPPGGVGGAPERHAGGGALQRHAPPLRKRAAEGVPGLPEPAHRAVAPGGGGQ
ncbi:uncharacterized protein ACNS7B_024505 [Menidia menidia]